MKNNLNDLNNAIYYCMSFWLRWGRIGSHGKEKYGTFRDHSYFWDGGIWSLVYPGHVRIRPKWRFMYFYIEPYFIKPITVYTGIHKLGIWYQKQVYNYAIQKMCKKYPNIVDEMVAYLDDYELVKPGIFGPIDGKVIHGKYWK